MSFIQNICIIDDDPICVFGIKKILREINFSNQITVYANGQEAIAGFENLILAGEKLPTVVLLDLNMPIMDGWDFLEDFKKLPNKSKDHVHINIISSSVDPRDILKAKEFSYVNNYFFKPIAQKDLLKVIAT